MTETPGIPRQPTRVFVVSKDDSVLNLITGFVTELDNSIPIEVRALTTDLIKDVVTRTDVVFLDAPKEWRLTAIAWAGIWQRLKVPHTIVLCGRDDAQFWQVQMLREYIADYFVIRPALDTSYLKVQVWRALRQAQDSGVKAAEQPLPQSAAPDDLKPAFAKYHDRSALVIEDDLPSMQVLRDMLRVHGFEVQSGNTVLNACARHHNKIFDLIFLDMRMPGISGPAAIPAVKDRMRNAAPIIVTSAYSDRFLVEECARQGVAGYIVKPVRQKTLLEHIDRALAATSHAGGGAFAPPNRSDIM